jgi:hypothetical protein
MYGKMEVDVISFPPYEIPVLELYLICAFNVDVISFPPYEIPVLELYLICAFNIE